MTEISLKRRAFAGLAAGAVAAVAVPEVVRATVAGPAAAPRSPGIAARAAGPGRADWVALANDLAGTLVMLGDAHYNTDRLRTAPC